MNLVELLLCPYASGSLANIQSSSEYHLVLSGLEMSVSKHISDTLERAIEKPCKTS